MSTIIQEAREALQRWRDVGLPGQWVVEPSDGLIYGGSPAAFPAVRPIWHDVTSLILGTAGNPDFLDAIDSVLAVAVHMAPRHRGDAEIIAATIVRADKEMSA